MMIDIAGLIIAGGYSSRMKDFKPLLPINGKPLMENRILSMAKAGISPVFVVTGHKREQLETIIHHVNSQVSPKTQVIAIYNPDYDQGMFASIKAGIRQINDFNKKTFKGALLLPVDYPLINDTHYMKLYRSWLPSAEQFAVPCYYGKKGHPLLIPEKAWSSILSYTGNKGLKGITNEYEDRNEMLKIEMKDERVLLDIDTPKDYTAILAWDPKDTLENRIFDFKGRLFLVRHGETQRHKEKIFLGQTDVKLSNIGKKQAINIAAELSNWNLIDPLLISSDLSRAIETSEIIRDNIKLDLLETTSKIKIIKEEPFRELNLGTWDGQYISKIKAAHPEEYEKRGRNLLSYKNGHGGENFYDLQYRVMKRLGDYMKKYPSRDLIIVAHSGSVRVILCNLFGMPLEEMGGFFVPRGSLNLISF